MAGIIEKKPVVDLNSAIWTIACCLFWGGACTTSHFFKYILVQYVFRYFFTGFFHR